MCCICDYTYIWIVWPKKQKDKKEKGKVHFHFSSFLFLVFVWSVCVFIFLVGLITTFFSINPTTVYYKDREKHLKTQKCDSYNVNSYYVNIFPTSQQSEEHTPNTNMTFKHKVFIYFLM